jgi:LTXXQ motif family protein
MGRIPRQPAVPSTNLAETCGGLAPGITDLPVDRIEEAVRPAADQMTAFENLKAASSKATDELKASCPSEVPLTPIGRLDAMKTRFDAMLQAVQVMRTPLEDFYNSLTDEQKQRFQAIGGGAEKTRGRDELAISVTTNRAASLSFRCNELIRSFSRTKSNESSSGSTQHGILQSCQ